MSEETGEIAAAFAKAQGQMESAVKDEVNPHFRSKFASLTSVINAVRKALSDNQIAWIQKSIPNEREVVVETVFYHSSGQSISSGPVSVPVDKANAHGVGSAMTYARRYSLAMSCGVGADDDDGNAAVANPSRSVTQTVIEESVGKVDYNKVAEYVAGLEAAFHNEDDLGMQELMEELADDNDMKIVVWSKLGSKVRTKLKQAAQNAA
jgi:hypothetical protein